MSMIIEYLTLEQLVAKMVPENMRGDRMSALVWDDYNLALSVYAGQEESPSDLTNEEQFLFALFILEAEGR